VLRDSILTHFYVPFPQVHRSHVFNDERQLWLQQIAEGPLTIVQPFNGYKVHGIRFHTRARSARKKTYSCGVLVKGTTSGAAGGVDYYGVLDEVLRVEYPGEPIKRCVLFRCDWFDPSQPRGTRYSNINCTFEVNHQRRYRKYEPFVLADVVYQVFYISYPSGVTNKSSWWAALLNKPRVYPHLGVDEGEQAPLVFQEEFMTSTVEMSDALPDVLVDNNHVDIEVEAVDVASADEDEPNEEDTDDESEWDDLESDTEDEDSQIGYHSDDDDSDDDEGDTDNATDD